MVDHVFTSSVACIMHGFYISALCSMSVDVGSMQSNPIENNLHEIAILLNMPLQQI